MDEIESVSGGFCGGTDGDLWGTGINSGPGLFHSLADFFGFDGHFGYQGGGGLSVGGLFGAVLEAAGHLWALPNTVIGGAVGLVGFGFDHLFGNHDATIRVENGAIRFENNAFVIPGTVITLGDAQIYSGSANEILNGQVVGAHESVHSSQQQRWGIFFFPAYIGAGIEALDDPGGFFREGNFFETPAYSR